jgi:hypothetical protein
MSNKIDSSEVKKIFNRGQVLSSDSELLYDICEMVYRIHYPHKYDDMDDLIQEGILGIIRLVDEGTYDETKGDILTFVYSRVRNYMSNYMYHTMKELSKSAGEEPLKKISSLDVDSGWFGFISEELIQGIFEYVEDKLMEHDVSSDLAYCVKAYFMDKLGVRYKVNSPKDYSPDFVEKYRYYVNLIEHGVFVKFINKKVFDNRISDIVDVLESEGEVGFYMRMFLDSLSDEQLTRLMYIYSLNSFQFPSKYRLLKVDNYLSIYRRVKHGKMTIDEAARMFDKPISTILSIMQKYDIIFS